MTGLAACHLSTVEDAAAAAAVVCAAVAGQDLALIQSALPAEDRCSDTELAEGVILPGESLC